MKVVVSESDPTLCELYHMLLEGTFEKVLIPTENDAESTIQMALQEQPAVIITSNRKTDCDAAEMVRRMRKHPELEKVPVILVTGSPTAQKDGTSPLFAATLIKGDFELDELLKAARQVASQTQA